MKWKPCAEEERGKERDLSLESITTTNGAIVSSYPNQSPSERRVVDQPNFLLGTPLDPKTPAPVKPVTQQRDSTELLLTDKENESNEKAANKTDEEKLTMSLSDEEKLTAIYLCSDYPDLSSICSPDLDSIDIDPEDKGLLMANFLEECSLAVTSVKHPVTKNVWEKETANSSPKDSDRDCPALPSCPPPHPAEIDRTCSSPSLEENTENNDGSDAGICEADGRERCTKSSDMAVLPTHVGDEIQDEVATAEKEEEESPLLSIAEILEQFPAAILVTSLPDTENVTSLQVEWMESAEQKNTEEEPEEDPIVTPFGRGLMQEERGRPLAVAQKNCSRAEDPQVRILEFC